MQRGTGAWMDRLGLCLVPSPSIFITVFLTIIVSKLYTLVFICVFCFQQDHPNVIKLYEYFEDETNVYLVTE